MLLERSVSEFNALVQRIQHTLMSLHAYISRPVDLHAPQRMALARIASGVVPSQFLQPGFSLTLPAFMKQLQAWGQQLQSDAKRVSSIPSVSD